MTKAECKEKYLAACEERYRNRDYPLKQARRLFDRCWDYYEEVRRFVAAAVQNYDKERYVCVLCGHISEAKGPCDECQKSNFAHQSRLSTDISNLSWTLANYIYNRGDGLVFQDFNEREQKCYLKAGFATFVSIIRDAVEAEVEKVESV